MPIFVRFLILSTILVVSLNAKWFFGNSAFVGSSFSSDSQAGLKMYVQHDALPALTVIGAILTLAGFKQVFLILGTL